MQFRNQYLFEISAVISAVVLFKVQNISLLCTLATQSKAEYSV